MTLDIFSIFSSNELSDIFALLFSDLAMSERRVQRQESRVFARQSTRQDGRHKKGTAVCDISLLFIVQPMHYCRICRLVRGKGRILLLGLMAVSQFKKQTFPSLEKH